MDVALYGMGTAIGDFDGDGLVDVFVTAVGENRLFRNLGKGKFEDVTKPGRMQFYDEAVSTGLGPTTRSVLTFGLFYLDYDLDGRSDFFCANGHLEDEINRVQPSQHHEQPPQMFWNAGPEQATEFLLTDKTQIGPDFLIPIVGRGASYADIDSDVDLDILITATGRAPRLLRNDQALDHHWLRIKLVGDGKHCNRDAIGSWITVIAGDTVQRKQVMPTKSYLSQVLAVKWLTPRLGCEWRWSNRSEQKTNSGIIGL